MGKKTINNMWDKLQEITKKDSRYSLQAYRFIFEALDYTARNLGKNLKSSHEKERHITGQQLLGGIRNYAMGQMGYMAPTIFELWGIHRDEDFGEIVFNLVASGLMGKTDSDTRQDFKGTCDFKTFFDDNFKFEGNFDIKFTWDYSWQKR
ncbi:MAG: Minf_1886 family protein [Candidatus Brocadiales bacterium]